MKVRQLCAETLGCLLACAPAMLAQSAPEEYSTVYYSDPVSSQPSGTGRFVYDPKTQHVSKLVWDFGNSWAGSLNEAYPPDPNLPQVLLSDIQTTGNEVTVRLVPPYIKGPFSSVQWQDLGSLGQVFLQSGS